jgi:hypothetical protein
MRKYDIHTKGQNKKDINIRRGFMAELDPREHNDFNKSNTTHAPWSEDASLKDKTFEAGVDYNQFIDKLRERASDSDMAKFFDVKEATISNLRWQFEEFGVNSIQGRD